MQPVSFFHAGVIVPNLEKAIARFSDVLGIEFEDPQPHPGKMVAAFSMTAPPYYELIQADGDGITSIANGGKILYFGIWESDMARRLEELAKQVIGWDALFRMAPTATPYAMITKPDLLGTRIEYVEDTAREPIEQWVRTGKYPGGIGA
jgi:hypothetical protein